MTTRTLLLSALVSLTLCYVASAKPLVPPVNPCCIACARCKCDRNCLCPKSAERYSLSGGDWWVMVYEPESSHTLAEMVAGSIRWSGSVWVGSGWIGLPLDKGAK